MNKKEIKHIGVLTSGGDAPGMNAAVRAVVRTCAYLDVQATAIMHGYSGILNKEFVPMKAHSVSKVISMGGTILKSSRCLEFKEREYRAKAVENLREAGIDALVVIGGDGSFRGAHSLYTEFNVPVVGVPGTIDNDIYGTDFTIGFDTAVNTAVTAIDKIRDTADSHNLIFFVEVMGRDAGFIGLDTAISTGAEAILIPDYTTTVEELCRFLKHDRRQSKSSGIIIVSEGCRLGNATEVAAKVKEKLPEFETRVTTLGHVQRGGSPTSADRVLASVLGSEAVNALLNGWEDVMIGQKAGETVYVPLEDACYKSRTVQERKYVIARMLAI